MQIYGSELTIRQFQNEKQTQPLDEHGPLMLERRIFKRKLISWIFAALETYPTRTRRSVRGTEK